MPSQWRSKDLRKSSQRSCHSVARRRASRWSCGGWARWRKENTARSKTGMSQHKWAKDYSFDPCFVGSWELFFHPQSGQSVYCFLPSSLTSETTLLGKESSCEPFLVAFSCLVS